MSTATPPTPSTLRANPDWADLPLFDRKGWSRVMSLPVEQVFFLQVE